jgi:1-acyl-sn-glycerol-3-phosphate acyltransferase
VDKQNTGIGSLSRQVFLIVWVVLSTVLYGTACLVMSIFSRKAAHWVAMRWIVHMLFFAGARVQTVGLKNLDRTRQYVFVSNHQSAFDIPALIAGLRPFSVSFIAKKQLFFIPFFGWGIAALGHIRIDRDRARNALKSIERAVGTLQKGKLSLVLFPEGTRSMNGELGRFRQASFILPILAGIPVVPVAVHGAIDVLPKKSLRVRPGKILLTVGAPVEVTGMTADDRDKACRQTRDAIDSMIRRQKQNKPAEQK